jgi:CHAT domain-containing protein
MGSTIYDRDEKSINTCLKEYSRVSKIDTLIDLGLYNLAFEAVNQNKSSFNDTQLLKTANRFIDNGEFDKGLSISKSIDQKVNYYDITYLRLNCALNKQDTSLANGLLNTLIEKSYTEPSPLKQLELELLKAYQAHNTKNYLLSIKTNEIVLKKTLELKLPDEFLAKVYHRLGNDYNDIVRDHILFHENKAICFQKGIQFYEKELAILIRSKHKDNTKIALNYITTAMLYRTQGNAYDVKNFYDQALTTLMVSQSHDFIVTRNPIYTSIALSQYGAQFFEYSSKKIMDSLLTLNEKLINTRSFYKINENQSLDVLEYFPQRSQEMKILFELKNNNDSDKALKIISLSNTCKYPNLHLNKNIKNAFHTKSTIATKNWILLNELKVFGEYYKKNNLVRFADSKLKNYRKVINKIIKQKSITITQKNLDSLKAYCKIHETSIIDYQLLTGGSMVIIIISKDGISNKWLDIEETISKQDIQVLNETMKTNDVLSYSKIAYEIYKKLGLNYIKTKNVIICADEILEKIPFDALVEFDKHPMNWTDVNFIGKRCNLRLIPNLRSILNQSSKETKLKIDLWASEKDNATLPFNYQLIEHLEKNFSVTKNTTTPSHILHIMAHTYRTTYNNIEFKLDTDTLTVYSNNEISPKLAILEGCSSGDGQHYKFEGSISQTRCFLYNGTPTIIYSLWDADNESSTELFKQFYHYVGLGFKTSVALNKAKIDLINNHFKPEWANPSYWANFQITGQDQSFMN